MIQFNRPAKIYSIPNIKLMYLWMKWKNDGRCDRHHVCEPRLYIKGHFFIEEVGDFLYCRRCKFMGSKNTFETYSCLEIK